MKIAIYNEHCIMKGLEVLDWDGKQESDDWGLYIGTPGEILAIADQLDDCKDKRFSVYNSRTAGTLRGAVYNENPELRTVSRG